MIEARVELPEAASEAEERTPTLTGRLGDPLRESRVFAAADDRVAVWQIVSTLAVAAALLAVGAAAPAPWGLLVAPALAPVLVRLFVLQHDAGHGSLFGSRARNERAGLALSWVSGVPYDPWRTEHNWHHAHQGKLSKRGVDRVNSPMTTEEAAADPAAAAQRARWITPWTVYVLGAWSLVGKRKRLVGFFPFRSGFPGPMPDVDAQRRGLRWTLAPHLLFHALLWLAAGPAGWAVFLVAHLLGAGLGAWLFWVQHNFEASYHADDASWDYVDVALRGSSYLRLGALGTWLTGSIGLHHVHHLNPRIPNYRLEAARRAVPALAAVAPMGWGDLGRCFTHVFWDRARRRNVALT